MRENHLRCKECGMQFGNDCQALSHLVERTKGGKACQARGDKSHDCDIDIEVWKEIVDVNNRRDLEPLEKWQEWYWLIYPECRNTAIDGRYRGHVTFALADLPQMEKAVQKVWQATPSLAGLSREQIHDLYRGVEKTLLVKQVCQKARKTRTTKPKQGRDAPIGVETPQTETTDAMQTGEGDAVPIVVPVAQRVEVAAQAADVGHPVVAVAQQTVAADSLQRVIRNRSFLLDQGSGEDWADQELTNRSNEMDDGLLTEFDNAWPTGLQNEWEEYNGLQYIINALGNEEQQSPTNYPQTVDLKDIMKHV